MIFRRILMKYKLRREARPTDVFTIYNSSLYNGFGQVISAPLFKVEK